MHVKCSTPLLAHTLQLSENYRDILPIDCISFLCYRGYAIMMGVFSTIVQ